MTRPDLNIDLGELPGEPDELYRLADRVNVACGGHAGDARSMRLACDLAREANARLGAHPSFDDRENFGRVALDIPPSELHQTVAHQCFTLARIALDAGMRVGHVKPHGALYHVLARDLRRARAFVLAVRETLGDVAIVGPPKGALHKAAGDLPYLREGFADRGYAPGGTLLPRGTPGALIESPEEAARQALRLAATGDYDTLCVHGDSPHALEVARAVSAALRGA